MISCYRQVAKVRRLNRGDTRFSFGLARKVIGNGCLPLFLVLFGFSVFSYAQPWSAIIDPTRATDWTSAGVVGGIPSAIWSNCTTSACNTLFGGTVTATSINNAITSAPANSVVRIPAGTFSVGALNITKSNVALRGAGANQTKINATSCQSGGGLGGSNCPWLHVMSGATGVGVFGGVTSANWTAGYAQGTTIITLSSTAGLVAGPVGTGSLIMLDQLDDASDGWPATGDIYSCASTSNNCSNQGGNNYGRSGRAQIQVVTVTAINGNQVTITPGLAYPNWRGGQSPGAYWNTGSPISNSGVEDMTIDFSGDSGQGIYIINAANVWVRGVRILSTNTGTAETYHIFALQSAHLTVQSNYIYGRPTTCSPFPLANYPYSDQETSDVVVENNIFDTVTEAMVPNDPAGRNVFAYNVVVNANVGVAGSQMHSGNIMMDLFEGNNMDSFMGDVTHGSHHFGTLFRNHFDGTTRNNSCTTGFAVGLLTNNRFFNVIGNVAGASSYTDGYEATLSNNNANAIFNIGWNGNNSGSPVSTDPNVKRTLMRWGNWDSVNNAVRFVNAEVPSGIANFSNAVPASQTLPASLYLPSRPSWWTTSWGTPKWPPIGPDVSGGNVSNSPTGGHADKIPARLCYENSAVDSAYSGTNPQVKTFNAATCYTATSGSPPAPPTGLGAAVH